MKCGVCRSSDCRLFYTQGNDNRFTYYRCANCGLVNYDQSCGLDQAKYAVSFHDPRDPANRTNRKQAQSYNFLKKHVTTRGALLEIGCGNGHLLYCAQNDGWRVVGLELSSELAAFVKGVLGVSIIIADFMDFEPRNSRGYDCIVLRHVLEHLPDPLAAMNKIHYLLAPGGVLLCEFPNSMALDLKVKRILHRCGVHQKKYRNDYCPGHCFEFSKKPFCFLLQKTGFSLIAWQTYSMRPFANFLYRHIAVGNKARALVKKA
ncbi:MAG: methyltransferase domain-containing protein [Chitinivibrionales bacterium]|nr:methyltransferase domain-containing protein [Chitinivibrionales bacterium]